MDKCHVAAGALNTFANCMSANVHANDFTVLRLLQKRERSNDKGHKVRSALATETSTAEAILSLIFTERSETIPENKDEH